MAWMVEDALEGRVTIGKSRGDSGREKVWVELTRKQLYQLEQFLQAVAEEGRDYYRVRMAVLLEEALRRHIPKAGEPGPPPGGEPDE